MQLLIAILAASLLAGLVTLMLFKSPRRDRLVLLTSALLTGGLLWFLNRTTRRR